jgi:hypothetical protein
MRGSLIAAPMLISSLVWLAAAPAGSITLFQVDDFQDGTTQGWGGGSTPTNVATGGPGGAGDRYLQLSAAGGNLGANHLAPWSGDYAAAGVLALGFDLNNFGPDPVAVRITLFGDGGAFSTISEVELAPGSGWVSVAFGLGEADLVQTQGTGTLAQTLASVNTLLIRHDPDPLSPPMQQNHVTATLGIDNVTAVPEPGTALLLGAGLAALAAGSRRSRRAAR